MANANGGYIGVNVDDLVSLGGDVITAKTSPGSHTLGANTRLIDLLIVAGGGGGGGMNGSNNEGGSGGGAGGVRLIQGVPVTAGATVPVTIGNGGSGSSASSGTAGNNSSWNDPSNPLAASGGGFGAKTNGFPNGDPWINSPGTNGGPGGSGGASSSNPGPGGGATTGTGNAGGYPSPEGNDGALQNPTASPNPSGPANASNLTGGGGGAGSVGFRSSSDSPTPFGAQGGSGLDITPTFGPSQPWYIDSGFVGGGGGGGQMPALSPKNIGNGGIGGGGSGVGKSPGPDNAFNSADPAVANAGGGGGGGSGAPGALTPSNATAGGNGGSGIIAIKELDAAPGVWSLQGQFAKQKQGEWPS
jgi:hypothetical protein